MTDVDRLAMLLEGGLAVTDREVDHEADQEPELPASSRVTRSSSAEERALVALAQTMVHAAPAVPPMRAEFRAQLRGELVQAARDHSPEAPLLTRLRDRVERFRYSTGIATGSGIAAMVLSGGGVAAAAELAQPGDVLYGTKQSLEDLRLTLTFDDAARGERSISYAFDRVDEARSAIAEERPSDAAVALDAAVDRVRDGTALVVESQQVGSALQMIDQIAALRAEVDSLRAMIGPSGEAAAGLARALDLAAGELAGVVVPLPGQPLPGQLLPVEQNLPGLPQLPLPSRAPDFPQVDANPAGVPEAVPVPQAPVGATSAPTGIPATPPVQLPDVPIPPLQTPDLPAPDLPVLPQTPPALDGQTMPELVVPDLVVPDVSGTVTSGLNDVMDILPGPVESVVPDAVDQLLGQD